MATTDLLSQTVLQMCCISQLCSSLTGSQGSKQPCNCCIQFQTSVCYRPNRAGPSVSLCYRKGSVLSVCNRLFRRTNSGTHPTFTQIHARKLQASHHEYNGQTVCLALFELWLFFFLVGLTVNKFANVAFGSPLLGCTACPPLLSVRSIFAPFI